MRTDRATTLLLFPAAILVMMILGAIAVDLGEVQLARRQMVREVGTAADDAADRLDVSGVRAGRLDRVDTAAATRTVTDDLALADLPGRAVGPPVVTVDPDAGTVTVQVTRKIPHIFGRAVPGAPDDQQITVRLSGRLHEPAP